METITYITSLLTFYIKGEISIDQNFVKLKDPNAILGLIPLGSKNDTIPVDKIASTQSNFKFKLGKFLIGLLLAVFALASLLDALSGKGFASLIIFTILAVNTIMNAFEIDLQINTTAGQQKLLDFFIFEKEKAQHAEALINSLIAGRLNDTNTRQQTDRIVEAFTSRT